jgi:serine/threonine protein kinase
MVVHGVGQKGRVIDYGTKEDDLDSLEQISFEGPITLYILQHGNIVEQEGRLEDIIHRDKHQKYIVKEFVEPPLVMKMQGFTAKTYMLRELEGFRNILPLLKTHVIGMPYKKTHLFGFVIGNRHFVVNRKCSDTMTETKVNSFSEKEFIKFVNNILNELVDIQKLNLAHGDIKLDNIMKCGNKYELIDWENSRQLDYHYLVKHRYLGLSPLYFKILYGPAWYASFTIALLKYYRETGGYDTYVSSNYANEIIQHYDTLFHDTTEEVFHQVKYELDLTAFGMILYGMSLRNPSVSKYHDFIMNLYKMKSAANALKQFHALFSKTKKNRTLKTIKLKKRTQRI